MNNQTFDFYEILEVNKNATLGKIKSSYRRLVLKYHPDKNNSIDAPEKFRKIQIAYETLSDDKKRKEYDSFDNMENCFALKYIFMYYQELIIDVCEKYELTDIEKDEIMGLFNPDDYRTELENNDIDTAIQKLSDKIFSFVPIFVMRKVSKNYPMLESAINIFSNWFV